VTESISSKIIKPGNCVLGFAIPTTRSTFEEHLRLKRDFASRNVCWGFYEHHIAALYRRVEPAFRQLGVNLRTGVGLNDFGDFFSGQFDVVVLFAHWNDNAIEFDDGFADAEAIVRSIPSDFPGLLDLCVCHPRDLVAALHRERPRLLVKSLDRWPASPRLWLLFYLALLTYLRDKESTYLTGLEEIVRQFSAAIIAPLSYQ
jgi:hypothetical protein